MNQMHNKILEAINNGVKLALDDFNNLENNSLNTNITNTNIIDDNEYLTKRARYKMLSQKIITASKDELPCLEYSIVELAFLAQELGMKFKVPNDRDYLHNLLKVIIYDNGDFKANLNWIDVSEVTDMSNLFRDAYFNEFDGDISGWDVSNVTDMSKMFMWTQFKGDISKWNVSNVGRMVSMFENSKFNGDISRWNVYNVVKMDFIFKDSHFNQDISKWNLKIVKINAAYGKPGFVFENFFKNNLFLNSPIAKNPEYWPH